jgi:hypothetical protein
MLLTMLSQCPSQAWSAGCLIDLYMDAAEEQAKFDAEGKGQELPLR